MRNGFPSTALSVCKEGTELMETPPRTGSEVTFVLLD